MLEVLPARDGDLVYWKRIENLSLTEISRRDGRSPKAISKRIIRAIEQLKGWLHRPPREGDAR